MFNLNKSPKEFLNVIFGNVKFFRAEEGLNLLMVHLVGMGSNFQVGW